MHLHTDLYTKIFKFWESLSRILNPLIFEWEKGCSSMQVPEPFNGFFLYIIGIGGKPETNMGAFLNP